MISILGAGPGDIKYLTLEGHKALIEAEKIIAFGRIGKSIESLVNDIVKVDRVIQILDHLENEKNILIVASGDPLFYGVTNFLKRSGVKIDKIYPGISSFQYLTCKKQISWQDAFLFSVHGRDFNIDELLNKSLSVGLMDKKHSPNWLSEELSKKGAKGKIIVGSNLSYESEIIMEGQIGDIFDTNNGLSVVVIEIDLD